VQIVNFKMYGSVAVLDENFEDWVYVGRENKHYGLKESPLANPYRVGSDGREKSIQQFKAYLWWKIQKRNPEVMGALQNLNQDSVLVCWCAPKPCHAEVIARAWAYCKQEGLI
jgi:hypothetical protein